MPRCLQIPNGADYKQAIKGSATLRALDRIDDFLSTHELHVNLPEELGSTIGEIKMPLTDQSEQGALQQGRSKMRVEMKIEYIFRDGG